MCDATSLDTSDEEMEGWSDKRGLRMDAETNKLVWCHGLDKAMMDNSYKHTVGQSAAGAADIGLLTVIGHVMLLLDTSCVTVMTVFSLRPSRTNREAECKLFLSTIPQSIRESNLSLARRSSNRTDESNCGSVAT